MKCPLCNKNLLAAQKVLGFTPREMVIAHGNTHIREAVTMALMAAWDVVRATEDSHTPPEVFKMILRERLETAELTEKLVRQWEASVK